MKSFILYGLKRPNENVVRYIGITSKSLEKRLAAHCRIKGENTRKDGWIKSMFPTRPEIVPYAVGLTKLEACDLETVVIAELRKRGFDLINISSGGEAFMAGKTQTFETRLKISVGNLGKKRSSDTCAKIAVSKMGDKNLMFGKPAPSRGKKRSFEARDKMAAAWTPERRLAQSARIAKINACRVASKGMN